MTFKLEVSVHLWSSASFGELCSSLVVEVCLFMYHATEKKKTPGLVLNTPVYNIIELKLIYVDSLLLKAVAWYPP